MKTTISSKGQLVLPRPLREQDHIEAGQEFLVERVRAGEYRLTRRRSRNQGLVKALLACPHRDWFTPLDSESTDTL
jgi:AbrB family looped-hinge helix DNA binding protein